MSQIPEPTDGVHPIGIEDLQRIGINAANELFWDGKRIEIRRPLILSLPQKILAAVVSLCAILGGLGALMSGVKDGAEYLCPRNIHWLGCPSSSERAGPPAG